jgi:hypothetical protein
MARAETSLTWASKEGSAQEFVGRPERWGFW